MAEVNETIKSMDGKEHPIRVYDNGGKTADRYTVVYMDQRERAPATYTARGMNHEPFHPQGIGMACIATPGAHLGRRITFAELPKDCQRAVLLDLTPLERSIIPRTDATVLANVLRRMLAEEPQRDVAEARAFKIATCRELDRSNIYDAAFLADAHKLIAKGPKP